MTEPTNVADQPAMLMSKIEAIKLRASFWNALSTGTFVSGLIVPLVVIFLLQDLNPNIPAGRWWSQTYIFSGAMIVAFIAGVSFRLLAIKAIGKLRP